MPSWFYWFLAGLLMVTVAFLLLVGAWQRQRRRKRVGVELTNTGNVRAAYELHADSPGGMLSFSFWLGGQPLGEQEVFLPGQDSSLYSTAQQAPAGQASSSGTPKAGILKRMLFGGADSIISILQLLAMLLPSSAASPLKQWAGNLRAAQTKGLYADRLQSAVSNLGPKARPAAQPQPAAAIRPGGAQREAWAQTPEIQPGESLALELYAQSWGNLRSSTVPLVIKSRPVGQPVEPLAETAMLQMPLTSWFARNGPYLAVIVVALAALAGAWRLTNLPLPGG